MTGAAYHRIRASSTLFVATQNPAPFNEFPGSLTILNIRERLFHEMAAQKDKKRIQPGSCPEGWLKAGVVVPVDLTVKQEAYARRAVGARRSVYNWLVANSENSREAALWLTPGDLEKEFNRVKHYEAGDAH